VEALCLAGYSASGEAVEEVGEMAFRPGPRASRVRMASVRPSENQALAGSPPRLTSGRTASERRSPRTGANLRATSSVAHSTARTTAPTAHHRIDLPPPGPTADTTSN